MIEKNPECKWVRFTSKTLRENLMKVPCDSLAIVGAAGTGLIRELVFGSKMELVQTMLLNPMVIVGPLCNRFMWMPKEETC